MQTISLGGDPLPQFDARSASMAAGMGGPTGQYNYAQLHGSCVTIP